MTAREQAERVLQGLPEELMPAALEALETVLKGEEVDEDLAALLDAEADELLGELDDAESEQPPVTCIGMISSGRGDLSARASRDEFEPPSSR
jgi:hypothetical protein